MGQLGSKRQANQDFKTFVWISVNQFHIHRDYSDLAFGHARVSPPSYAPWKIKKLISKAEAEEPGGHVPPYFWSQK